MQLNLCRRYDSSIVSSVAVCVKFVVFVGHVDFYCYVLVPVCVVGVVGGGWMGL